MHSPTAAPLPSAPAWWLLAIPGPRGAAQPGVLGSHHPLLLHRDWGRAAPILHLLTSPCQPSSTFPNPSRMHPHEDHLPKLTLAPVLLGDAWQHLASLDVPPGLGFFLIPSVHKLIPRHSHFPNKLKPYRNAPTRRSSVRLQPLAAQRYVKLSHGAAAAPTSRCRQYLLQQWVPQAPLHPITPLWPPVGPQPVGSRKRHLWREAVVASPHGDMAAGVRLPSPQQGWCRGSEAPAGVAHGVRVAGL